MRIRFQPPANGSHGWYVRTLGYPKLYLHTDGELYDKDTTNNTRYFDDAQHAMDTLVKFLRDDLTPTT